MAVMIWPAWLGIGTPLKCCLWLGNRLTTWLGLFFFWKRFRSERLVWLWVFLINAASLAGFVVVLFWLYRHPVR